MIFSLKSTIDLNVVLSTEVTDKRTSAGYYTFDIVLPDGVPNGEYEYVLMDDDTVLSSGLLVIGENFHPGEYNKEISYEQYATE